MCGLGQDQPAWIEPKRVEAMAMKLAVRAAAIRVAAMARYHANQWLSFRQTAENCGHKTEHETERRWGRTLCFRHDFMQSAAGETALRQVGIDGGKAERQRPAESLQARQQTA
jgi:hypothetical protein